MTTQPYSSPGGGGRTCVEYSHPFSSSAGEAMPHTGTVPMPHLHDSGRREANQKTGEMALAKNAYAGTWVPH